MSVSGQTSSERQPVCDSQYGSVMLKPAVGPLSDASAIMRAPHDQCRVSETLLYALIVLDQYEIAAVGPTAELERQ